MKLIKALREKREAESPARYSGDGRTHTWFEESYPATPEESFSFDTQALRASRDRYRADYERMVRNSDGVTRQVAPPSLTRITQRDFYEFVRRLSNTHAPDADSH